MVGGDRLAAVKTLIASAPLSIRPRVSPYLYTSRWTLA